MAEPRMICSSRSICLQQVVWQAGDGRTRLPRRSGYTTRRWSMRIHFGLLCAGIEYRLALADVATFEDAVRIFSTNGQVKPLQQRKPRDNRNSASLTLPAPQQARAKFFVNVTVASSRRLSFC